MILEKEVETKLTIRVMAKPEVKCGIQILIRNLKKYGR
jgi:hypothetical protein